LATFISPSPKKLWKFGNVLFTGTTKKLHGFAHIYIMGKCKSFTLTWKVCVKLYTFTILIHTFLKESKNT
jgi:hypothetical protein